MEPKYINFGDLPPYLTYGSKSGGYKVRSSILGVQYRPSYYEPKCGGGGCGASANENSCAHHVTRSPSKLWRSNSIFAVSGTGVSAAASSTWRKWRVDRSAAFRSLSAFSPPSQAQRLRQMLERSFYKGYKIISVPTFSMCTGGFLDLKIGYCFDISMRNYLFHFNNPFWNPL